jgi:phosphoribosylanthranilate isomerase
MIPTKICGITRIEDAKVAIENGASALGFIFYNKSPRYITINQAMSISNKISKSISLVGVFVNQDQSFINNAIKNIPLNMIQLHGNESQTFCKQFSVPVIKAIRIKDKESLDIIKKYNVDGLLLDTYSENKFGGTGKSFDWKLLNTSNNKPIILSGGLSPKNIIEAITIVNPIAIDVNSGVELSPGKKNHKLIQQLFTNIKNTQSSGFKFG